LDADLPVVILALGAGTGVLRDAEHALHAAGDASDHTAHGSTDNRTDRTEHLAAVVEAFLGAAPHALRIRGSGGCDKRKRRDGK
jgi:hypothetical protein